MQIEYNDIKDPKTISEYIFTLGSSNIALNLSKQIFITRPAKETFITRPTKEYKFIFLD